MSTPAYPPARVAASRVQSMFASHVVEARRRGAVQVATVPDADAIESIINAAFWASLRREEGYVPKISLAFVGPDETPNPMSFERPLPLDSVALTHVAPAVERAGIHLGVWRDGDRLVVWGTTQSVPVTCFVLEVAAPGLLVVKHHRGEELSKFVNVAVLEGDEIKIIDERASRVPDCPPLLGSLLAFDSASWLDSVNVLVQLAVSMRGHGRGGSLLVVPPASDLWRESIVRPISYAISPPFSELAVLYRESQDEPGGDRQKSLAAVVNSVAGLTAVDGAVVLTADYHVLAFGAKIARRRGSPLIEQVMVTQPIEGALRWIADPAQLGGTRHLSAAQFAHDQRDALALVASQDGRFTIFAWSPSDAMVHAHRVEALLL